MKITGLAITVGLGMAAGAVAAMMLPRQSTARKLIVKAADKVEDTATMVSTKISQKLED